MALPLHSVTLPYQDFEMKISTLYSIDLPAGHWRWWFTPLSLIAGILLFAPINLIAVGIVVPLLLSMIFLRGVSAEDFGLVIGNVGKLALLTLLAFGIMTGAVWVFESNSPEAVEASNTVIRSLGFGVDYQTDLNRLLLTCLFAPIGEELILRGAVFRPIWNAVLKQNWLSPAPGVKKWLAFLIATGVSTFLFAQLHSGEGQDSQIVMVAMLSIIACGLYALTGSILAPILFHALNNAFAVWQSLSMAGVKLSNDWLYGFIALSPVITLCIMLAIMMIVKIIAAKWPIKV